MVNEEKRQKGISVTEINNYEKIIQFIIDQSKDIEYECDVYGIYAVGDFGSGYGIPGKSELDILITVIFKNSDKTPLIKKDEFENKLDSHNFGKNFGQVKNINPIVSIMENKDEIIQNRSGEYEYYYDIYENEKIEY